MPVTRFIRDPSLEQKDSRARGLLIADAKAHITKHVHSTRSWKKSPLRISRARRIIDRNPQHQVRGGCTSLVVAKLPKSIPADRSNYLQRTYSERNAKHINNLCDYFIHMAGPMYVWDLVDSDHERQKYQTNIITWFLNEPSLSESLLAWLQCLWDRKTGDTNASSVQMIIHQSRSLSAIRRLLDDPHKTNLQVLLWSVVANLVLNQECQDWASFKVNLAGLQHIISLLGGMDALQRNDLRAHMFVAGLQKVLSDRENDTSTLKQDHLARTSPQPSISVLSDLSHPDLREGTKMPRTFVKLHEMGELSIDIATELCNGIRWLRCSDQYGDYALHSTEENETMAIRKVSIESTLDTYIEGRLSSDTEFVLCVGMLIKLATRRPVANRVQKLGRASRVSSWIRRIECVANNSASYEIKLSVLWTALVIMEMVLNIGPGFGVRLSFLKLVMSKFSAQASWSQICDALADIYLSHQISPLWKSCWRHRARTSPWVEEIGLLHT